MNATILLILATRTLAQPSAEALYAHEPAVDAVVAMALERAAVAPGRARATASRSRSSAWLPDVSVRARRGQGWDLSSLVTADADRTNLSTADQWSVEGALTFRLSQLVYGRDEVPLLREERAIAAERRELARAVVTVYFVRRRLQLERDREGKNDVAHAVGIAAATAELDALTGGGFSRAIRPRARAPRVAGPPPAPPAPPEDEPGEPSE